MGRIYITKASGEKEPFLPSKLSTSLRAARASQNEVDRILADIEKRVEDGMSTSKIYKYAFSLLKKLNKSHAAKYSLKRAIMQLGPDGFPFEQYVAALLRNAGYKVFTNQVLRGLCITHEVDVVAEYAEKNIHAIIEAKFHSTPGRKTATKEILYTHARFLDIEKQWVAKRNSGAKPMKGEVQSWLVTNTSITSEVIKYSRCTGISVISWDYPKKNNLQSWIHDKSLYPVTVLLTLTHREKKILLDNNCVLCKDVLKCTKGLKLMRLSKQKRSKLEEEITQLCV